MTDNVDDFLEHFGVKGMRWGQRRSARKAERARLNSALDQAKADRDISKEMYRRAKANRNSFRKETYKQNATVGLATASVVVGAAAVTTILANKGKTPIKSVPDMPFSISGPLYNIRTNSGEAMDIAVKAITENRKLGLGY